MKRKILKTLMCFGFLASFASFAVAYPMTAALNAVQVVPATGSAARGSCKIVHTFGYGGESYEVNCEFSGLSGGLIDANIRIGSVGQNGAKYCDKELWVKFPNTSTGGIKMTCAVGSEEGAIIVDFASKGLYLVLQTQNFPEGEIRGQIRPAGRDQDVNGEGRSEISVFRPGTGEVFSLCGITGNPITVGLEWSQATDSTPFMAEFDGDGIADIAFLRTLGPNSKGVVYRRSSTNKTAYIPLSMYGATPADIPVFADFNGDHSVDPAIFRPSTGIWHIMYSYGHDFYPPTERTIQWGTAGDTPCPADYDADGTADLCVIRQEAGQLVWYIRRSTDTQMLRIVWGLNTDSIHTEYPVDVDADGANDVLVSRVENGKRVFYALRSSDQSLLALQWGLQSDTVKLGDYDGDGKTDFGAVRETNSHLTWYIYQSSDQKMRVHNWGLTGDM